MDLAQASQWAQILSLLPGTYCAYGTWVLLQSASQQATQGTAKNSPAMLNTTGLLISLGLFLLCVAAGGVLAAVARFKVHKEKPSPKTKEPEVEHVTEFEAKRFYDVKQQLSRLSAFEMFALWQILLKDGITGEQFGDSVRMLGFPVTTQFDLNQICSTYDEIHKKVTFLAKKEDGKWSIKSEFQSLIYFFTSKSSPLFGI